MKNHKATDAEILANKTTTTTTIASTVKVDMQVASKDNPAVCLGIVVATYWSPTSYTTRTVDAVIKDQSNNTAVILPITDLVEFKPEIKPEIEPVTIPEVVKALKDLALDLSTLRHVHRKAFCEVSYRRATELLKKITGIDNLYL